MTSVEEHKAWLQETTRRFLQRMARWRRRIKLGLTIGGALVAGAAGTAANLLDQKWRWPLYAFQIVGLLMVAAGAALVEYLDENTAEAINRAGDLARTVEERDAELASLETDYGFSVRLQAVAVALREIVNQVAASGPGAEDAQKARLGLMLDFVVADRVPLFGMDTDRFNFAIYVYDPAGQFLHCAACVGGQSGRRKTPIIARGIQARAMLGWLFRASASISLRIRPDRTLDRYSTHRNQSVGRTISNATNRSLQFPFAWAKKILSGSWWPPAMSPVGFTCQRKGSTQRGILSSPCGFWPVTLL